ncbi:MAG: NPP1 family protein [Myxococcota bacterium]|nr:NPP1 family protein [Myxococcota bacterium]
MRKCFSCGTSVFLFVLIQPAQATDFPRLDQAIPGNDVSKLAPVFDFDGDGCLPSAGISRGGEKNPGLKTSGDITGECRASRFLDTSNTLHRSSCTIKNGSRYCGHFYALYFEKDQTVLYGGHRHDWEHAAIWTKNGVITHGSVSVSSVREGIAIISR